MTCYGTTTSSSPGSRSANSQTGTDSWSLESAWNQEDPLAMHKGFESIASSLSLLTKTIGMAIEEQRHLVESKSLNSAQKAPHSPQLKNVSASIPHSPSSLHETSQKSYPRIDNKQMKRPQELALAMTTKAKFLLQQLKGVRQHLAFSTERCSQLEEENKRLREGINKGDRHDDDDLVRLQLETLLAEKARLAQENSTYLREIQYLQELVQYQQLKLQQLAAVDEGFMFDEELTYEGEEDGAVVLLPTYTDENENPNVIKSPPAC